MSPRLPTPVFTFSDTVYQRAAPETAGGMVTGLLFRPGGGIIYLVSWPIESCTTETEHWDFELTVDKEFRADT